MQFIVVMTRISNYRHHWGDVLAGLILGATLAILKTVFVTEFFKTCDFDGKEKIIYNLKIILKKTSFRTVRMYEKSNASIR